jgi:hypothetical protein
MLVGTASDPAAGMQVTNMGRVLFLAVLSTILLIGNADRLAAQGRAGAGASGGGVAAGGRMAAHAGSAGMAVHGGGGVGAGASSPMRGSSMAPARAAGHVTSSPGSHLAITRSPGGQIMPRRASAMRGSGRPSGSASTRTRQFRSQRGVGTDFSDDSNVPGLGFDAVHVAATRGNRGHDRDHGRDRGDEFGVLLPFFGGGGYYVPTGPDMVGNAQGDGQPIEDAEDQGPVGNDLPDDHPYGRPSDGAARMGSAERLPAEQLAPQRDVEEYVFVRRDGTVFFAVAYTWDQGSLRYISSEGMKHSVSRDTLDLKATQQFNEERGLTFRAPA